MNLQLDQEFWSLLEPAGERVSPAARLLSRRSALAKSLINVIVVVIILLRSSG